MIEAGLAATLGVIKDPNKDSSNTRARGAMAFNIF
jgi:hypothetical protein